MVEISPSLLSCNFANLEDEVRSVEPYVNWLHVDIMDGHFVPNITFGPALVSSLRKITKKHLDCHLMVEEPMQFAPRFLQAGADSITVHQEVCTLNQFKRLAKIIHDQGKKIGITLRPRTALKHIKAYLPYTDLVLVMSVEPGFGGQGYIASSTNRIRKVRKLIDEINSNIILQVDGGINKETAILAREAGADNLVSGSFVFRSKSYAKAIESLR
jgi:ribulose-phosphate 3-epimerase